MTLVHETDVEGVRTFWVDSGRPTLAATLMFRAGMADERLTTSGWLHLLEHLALHGLPRGTLAVNGSVGVLSTTFSMHGPPDQVVAALAQVTRRLADPDLDELERERRVLTAESATRGGPVQRAMGMRYGAQGPGLVSYDDVALGRADAASLIELSRSAFASGNGTLALDGPPPEGLELALPEGPTWPERGAQVMEQPRTAYVEPAGLVLSGTVERTPYSALVPVVVEDALRRRLRDQDGAAYAPYSLYEPVDADRAVVLAGSDVSPATHETLLRTVLELADTLAADGPEPQSLADITAAMRQGFTDPYNVGFLSHRAAAQALRGRPLEQLDELLAELDAVSPETLVPGLATFHDTLMVGAPSGTHEHPALSMVEQPQVTALRKGVRSVNWPADASRMHLVDRVLVVGNDRSAVQYPVDDLAGYLTWEDGARGLVLADGWSFSIVPAAWSGGTDYVARLDQLVPRELHLPQPRTTAPEPPPRHGLVARWSGGLRRTTSARAARALALLLWLLVAAVVVSVMVALAVYYPPGLAPAVVGLLVGLWTSRRKDGA
ncbi:hypothetical protein L2K70_05390 [Nocardioides KLBMP 9356]|uniref:Insulinase family protein n=1 Tax=Nocardioides potassii TaxID=2911371 RepID=A0ABS9H727_9ACTN|nr:hypothetical protein [Nocardioides potassii]MCF6377027.1 hypothetical protein [Nocardioides potassii]